MDDFFTIIKKYPFICLSEDPIKVIFQFDIPSGWHKLFIKLCDNLLAYIVNHPKANLKVFDASLKDGRLKLSFKLKAPNKENQIIRHKISAACRRSAYICVDCGATAKVITKGYEIPLCYKCARRRLKEENQRHKTNFSFKKVYRKSKLY